MRPAGVPAHPADGYRGTALRWRRHTRPRVPRRRRLPTLTLSAAAHRAMRQLIPRQRHLRFDQIVALTSDSKYNIHVLQRRQQLRDPMLMVQRIVISGTTAQSNGISMLLMVSLEGHFHNRHSR